MLTYGGIPLLVPDRRGELHRWIDEHFDLENLPVYGECPTWMAGNRHNDKSLQKAFTGLPAGNYPAPPPPRLNTLYWPTGAARWARGYFLATAEAVGKILNKLSTPQALPLVMGDEVNDPLTINLHLLAPRRLSGHPFDTIAKGADLSSRKDQLYLVPLVDERYFWQYLRSASDPTYDSSLTWAQLFTALLPGISMSTPDSRYLAPDWVQFDRVRDNVGMLLDAASLSIGQRMIRNPDGSVSSTTPETATTALAANLSSIGEPIAGGYHQPGIAPESVSVSFPKLLMFRPLRGDLAHETYTPSQNAELELSGARKQVFSSAYYPMPDSIHSWGSYTAALTALAAAIGEDYYAWRQKRYSFTWNGLKGWNPTGFDDHVTWEIGRPDGRGGEFDDGQDDWDGANDDGQWICKTRVECLPENFGVEHQLSQHLPVLGPFQFGVTTTALSDCKATVRIWEDADDDTGEIDDCADWEERSPVLEVIGNDFLEIENLPVGTRVEIEWDEESAKWVFLTTAEPGLVYFQLYDEKLLLSPQPFLATVLTFNGTTWVDSGVFIKVYDGYYNNPGFFTGKAGIDRGWAKLRERAVDPDPDDYELIWMSGPAHSVYFELTQERFGTYAAGLYNATVEDLDHFPYGHNQLFDAQSFQVYFREDAYPWAIVGCRGRAIYNDRERRYEVFECEQIAMYGQAVLASDMCSTEGEVVDFTADSPYPFNKLPTGVAGMNGSSGSVQNARKHKGEAGDIVFIVFIAEEEVYSVVDVELKEIEVVVNVRWDATTGCWMQQKQKVALEKCELPEQEESINCGEPC